MKLQSVRALRGPNRWNEDTALEAVVTVAECDVHRLEELRAIERWLAPTSEGGSHAARTGAPEQWAEWLAQLALGVQIAAGIDVELASAMPMAGRNEFRIVVQYDEEEVGRRAFEVALTALNRVRAGEVLELDAEVAALRKQNLDVRLGPSTGSMVRAAQARGIPARRLTDGSLVQLGFGSRQRRIWAAETQRTSAIAESIAQDKELTKSLLARIAIPVPEGRPARNAEEAWEIAREVGVPVVVKPRKGNQGKCVCVGLTTEEAVRGAFEIAVRHDGEVLVERQIEGSDFRLLIVGGRMIAAARREPPSVMGDGSSTIAELVAEANLDPRRGDDHSTSLSKLRLDEIGLEMLAEQGLTPDSVPAKDRRVVLRRNANLSTGGSATDVTDEVHPEVAQRAIEAAAMIGLDIAGIDVLATRIDVPLGVSKGAIVEVNAAPGLRMHLEPSSGKGRDVGRAIVDSLFALGDDGRIPVVSITGTNGKTTTTRCIAHLMRQRGLRVGMTCTDGIYVEGRCISTGDCAGPKSAKIVLGHPRVDVAVLETARGGMLREGLGFDYCDVAVVTNIGEGDHLGLNGIESVEELAEVKSIPVRQVSPTGAAVLNADDPLVVRMAALCRGTVIYFSRDPRSPELVAHRRRGGRAVTLNDGFIVIAHGDSETRVADVRRLPLTHGGRVGFQIENLLAATAAAYWLGLPLDTLRLGLEGFSSDLGIVPGRFNVLEHRGATLILDYGHNASALLALIDALRQIPHHRRKVVYTAAGDRRDSDIRRQAEIIARFFDDIYIYEDKCTRGRPPGETKRLMREGFARSPRPYRVHDLSGELASIEAAIGGLGSSDLLLCQVDQVELALDFVTRMLRQSGTRPLGPLAQFAAVALAAPGVS